MFKVSCKLIVMFSFCMVLPACFEKPKNEKAAYSHFKLGVTLLSQNKKSEALDHLIKAKDMDPDNPLFLNHLGLNYYLMGEYEHAVVTLQQALEIKPAYSEAHNNLGRVYIDIKNFAAAREHLNKAAADLTYTSKDKVWLNLGLSYFFEQKYATSENYFLKAISMNRSNCLAYNYFGRALVEREQYERAAKALDQAIYHCRSRGLDEPHYYSGISLFRLGYKSKAIARLQEGRKRFPKGPNRKKIDEMINLMKITESK